MLVHTLKRLFGNTMPDKETGELSLVSSSAALLIEMSLADDDKAPEEIQVIEQFLRFHYGLQPDEIAELIAEAEHEQRNNTSLYRYTSVIKQADAIEKQQIIETLWRVAWSDGRVTSDEEHLIRKVAELIYVSHSDFIRLKLATQP